MPSARLGGGRGMRSPYGGYGGGYGGGSGGGYDPYGGSLLGRSGYGGSPWGRRCITLLPVVNLFVVVVTR